MGIVTSLKTAWRTASTAEKIDLVLGILCGFGAGAVSGQIMKQYAPGMNKIERVCASITMCGLGMAAGEKAQKAYGPYTKAAGAIIDAAKKKTNQPKEESKDGEYTRY